MSQTLVFPAASPDILTVKVPAVTNLSMPTAGTEYSFALPANSKRILFKSRNYGKLRFAFISGDSVSTYISIAPGAVFTEVNVNPVNTITLYVNSSVTNDILEILTWT